MASSTRPAPTPEDVRTLQPATAGPPAAPGLPAASELSAGPGLPCGCGPRSSFPPRVRPSAGPRPPPGRSQPRAASPLTSKRPAGRRPAGRRPASRAPRISQGNDACPSTTRSSQTGSAITATGPIAWRWPGLAGGRPPTAAGMPRRRSSRRPRAA
jgi:hypothetical protein